jgi:hypothetical protein
MTTKEELAAKLAAHEAERQQMAAELAVLEGDTAELEALESDKQRVIAAHDRRRKFCEAELLIPLAERTRKDHSDEPRDDEAIQAELAALEIDCARMVAVHDQAIVTCKARAARR